MLSVVSETTQLHPLAANPSLHRTHHAQLQALATMLSQHADTDKISGIVGMRRWNHTGKSIGSALAESQPPMALIEFRHRRAIKECKPVEFSSGYPRPPHLAHQPRESGTSADPRMASSADICVASRHDLLNDTAMMIRDAVSGGCAGRLRNHAAIDRRAMHCRSSTMTRKFCGDG